MEKEHIELVGGEAGSHMEAKGGNKGEPGPREMKDTDGPLGYPPH